MQRLSFLIILILFVKFTLAQSPHGDELEIDCEECHSAEDWSVNLKQVKFDHVSTGFKLTGQHINTDCKSCHSNLIFKLASPQCFSCHQDIHQSTVGIDCQDCHTSDSWLVTDIRGIHEKSRFPLIGVHLTADCNQCHTGYQNLYFEELSIDCFSCHQNDFNTTTSPNHVAAGFSTQCQDCHNIASSTWSAQNINHDFFPLIGGHRIENCFACHQQGGTYSGLSTDCYSCHRSDYEQVEDPNHLSGNFPLDCTQCHTINGWEPANFNHANTQFPLTGAHLNVDCANCHSQTYSGTPTVCVECHQENFNATLNPNHNALGISTDCQTCHSTSAWIPSSFDHINTGFELTGQHSIAECSSCHEGTTTGLSQECISCHQVDFNQSVNPNHTALSIPTDCQTCHTPTENWEPAAFQIHNNYYELIGAHAAISNDCITCHNDNYNTTPNTCIGCHQTDYDNTSNPSHIAANFPTQCESCHGQNAWTPATFDHDNQFFPIYSGSHREKWNACSDCHTSTSNFAVFSCIDCHEHNQADTDNDHQGVNGYAYNSDACFACHPTGDGGSAFDHSLTSFPLTGTHTTVECQQCHQQGYSGTTMVCYDCHQTKYNNSTNPNHTAIGLSTDCQSCHTTSGWSPSSFNHTSTGFELAGSHAPVSCSSCHTSTAQLNSDCISCHQDDYNATPNHASQNFPANCSICHNSVAWNQSTFNHQNTSFPLTGEHSSVGCNSCHSSGYTGTPTECNSCHNDNYSNSTNPNHQAAGISTNCQSCHTTSVWNPSSFNHTSSGFELLGQHSSIQCSSCHQGTTSGLDGLCISCHQVDYNNAPNHTSQNFPTTCNVCHNSVAWNQSTFNHQTTAFPLTGAHTSVNCNSCHTSGYTGTTVVCYECHQSSYNNSSNPGHTALSLSTNCEDCHTTNSGWAPASFSVHNNYYPLIGAHAAIANNCITCHNGNYNTTLNTCYGCHQSDYNSTNNPPHQTSGFSQECETCHTQSAWTPATFDHDNQFFPIYSGKHREKWDQCSDCHTNSSNFSIFSCINCHEHNQSQTDDDHSEVNGYIYSSDACYDCHPNGDSDMIRRFKIKTAE